MPISRQPSAKSGSGAVWNCTTAQNPVASRYCSRKGSDLPDGWGL